MQLGKKENKMVFFDDFDKEGDSMSSTKVTMKSRGVMSESWAQFLVVGIVVVWGTAIASMLPIPQPLLIAGAITSAICLFCALCIAISR